MSQFPHTLKTWRKTRHFSQLDLANEAEVSLRHLSFLETGRAKTLFEAVRLSGAQRRVTAVFARDTRMSEPFDAEAFGQGNTRTRPWMTDTVWLTLALQDRGIALAHELFHVLANSGRHSEVEGNLMLRQTTGDNRILLPEQCELLGARRLRTPVGSNR